MDVLFKRKVYDRLLEWKATSNGTSAILIEGARRVGKSTVVEEFAHREYRSSVIIDFMKPKAGVMDIFEHYYSDIPKLLSSLGILYGISLWTRDTVFVFDEVQHYPKARQLIKYLVLDGRFDFIETGSLISIKRNTKQIQIPSEEERIDMHPLDFEEWLWANGDEVTIPYLRDHFVNREPLGPELHKVILEKYKTYMLVGGMPQAVSAFLDNTDFKASEKKKRSVISLYRADMLRIPVADGSKALAIFNRIPSLLSRHRKTFRPGVVNKGSKTEDYENSMVWLDEARIVNACYETNDPNISVDMDRGDQYKCYLLDTGLLLTLAFDEGLADMNEVQMDFIKGRLSVNQGMLFENMVAQELVMGGHSLRFTEFYDRDDDKHIHEIDFIIPKGTKIVPIEVKSSVSSKHRSLDLFMERYSKRIDTAYVIHSKDLKVDGRIVYVPIYMTMFL